MIYKHIITYTVLEFLTLILGSQFVWIQYSVTLSKVQTYLMYFTRHALNKWKYENRPSGHFTLFQRQFPWKCLNCCKLSLISTRVYRDKCRFWRQYTDFSSMSQNILVDLCTCWSKRARCWDRLLNPTSRVRSEKFNQTKRALSICHNATRL